MNKKISVIVVCEDNSLTELLKRYINDSDNFFFLASVSDFSKAYDAVKELSKSLVIVDMSDYQEQALNFINRTKTDFPEMKVIAFSDKPDVELAVRTMRMGASDLLSLPLIKDEFYSSISRIYDDLTGQTKEKTKCRIITVYSNKGGAGKTSVASNLAYELARITKENVALIDLNFQLGDIAPFFDLNPSFNISYMLQNSDKINGDFLISTLEKYKDTSLYILADPPSYAQTENISSKDITKLFKILRNTFSYIVVDTSGGFDSISLTALENSDLVFLVTIVNLPALRNCQRCMELLEKSGIDADRIQVLINRYMENDEISSGDVEEVLGKKLYWKIPNNYFTMMTAINSGIPVSAVNPDSNVAISYKNLALLVSDNVYRQKFDRKTEGYKNVAEQ